jgi:Ca2+-binding EF-hand superfamily protein
MKYPRLVLAATLLAGTSLSFAAAHMNTMDTNGDGMVSKQEFLSHHEAMFDKMDKGGKGMVPAKDMEMSMRGQAMRGDRASRADKMKMDERARKGEGAVPAPAAK